MTRTIPLDVDTDELERLLRSTAKDLAEMAGIVDVLLSACKLALPVIPIDTRINSARSIAVATRLREAIAMAEGGRAC